MLEGQARKTFQGDSAVRHTTTKLPQTKKLPQTNENCAQKRNSALHRKEKVKHQHPVKLLICEMRRKQEYCGDHCQDSKA